MGFHLPTLRPKYIPYSYMDPLGRSGYWVVGLGFRAKNSKPSTLNLRCQTKFGLGVFVRADGCAHAYRDGYVKQWISEASATKPTQFMSKA